MSRFGGLANMKTLWRSGGLLWRADFAKLAGGTDTTPAGLIVASSTAGRTVQDGDDLVMSSIPANVLMIGRSSTALARGAVLEASVVNDWPMARDFSLWASSGTFVPPSAGTDSPDRTQISAQISCASGSFGKYQGGNVVRPKENCSFWRRSNGSAPKRASLYTSSPSHVSSPAETGTVDLNWSKTILYMSAAAGVTSFIVPVDGRGGNAGSYASVTDCSTPVFTDMVLTEAGLVSHEFTLTSKSGTLHAVPVSIVAPTGQLSLHIVMRPKGSIAGSTPWTWSPVLWQNDANNYCQIDGTSGVITSVINGSPAATSSGITFGREDRLEWWYVNGIGSTTIKLRANLGAVQSFSLPAQGPIATIGNIGLGCSPSNYDVGSLEGTYELIEAYGPGFCPLWAA
jgi:hypothetical protein